MMLQMLYKLFKCVCLAGQVVMLYKLFSEINDALLARWCPWLFRFIIM